MHIAIIMAYVRCQEAELNEQLRKQFDDFHTFCTTRFFGQQADPIADVTANKYADHARQANICNLAACHIMPCNVPAPMSTVHLSSIPSKHCFACVRVSQMCAAFVSLISLRMSAAAPSVIPEYGMHAAIALHAQSQSVGRTSQALRGLPCMNLPAA